MPFVLAWPRLGSLRQLLLWIAASLLFTLNAHALEVPPLQGRVNDHAGILSPAVEESLTRKLAAYEQATGHQLAILTIPTLAGDPIEDFSIRVVEAWKLGKKGVDDGVLLLVASNDRKMRIEVGYGLEGDFPDAAAGRVVRDVMAPHFRRGDFESGITAGVNAVLAATGAQALAGQDKASGKRGAWQADDDEAGVPKQKRAPPSGILGWAGYLLSLLFKFAFFGIFVLIVLFLLITNLLSGGFRGGFFGGFGGGGGFSGGGGGGFDGFSGGGGGFGGGGASGDW